MPIAIVFFIHYAYLLIFLWVLVEQIGIPIPSIPVLLTAGTLSATHRVSHPLRHCSRCWSLASSPTTIWYALGRRYGNSVLKLLCRLSFEASTCVTKTEGYFTRRGAGHTALREVRPRAQHRRGSHRRPDRHVLPALPRLGPRRLAHLGRDLHPRRPLLRRSRQSERALLRTGSATSPSSSSS